MMSESMDTDVEASVEPMINASSRYTNSVSGSAPIVLTPMRVPALPSAQSPAGTQTGSASQHPPRDPHQVGYSYDLNDQDVDDTVDDSGNQAASAVQSNPGAAAPNKATNLLPGSCVKRYLKRRQDMQDVIIRKPALASLKRYAGFAIVDL